MSGHAEGAHLQEFFVSVWTRLNSSERQGKYSEKEVQRLNAIEHFECWVGLKK